MSRQAPSKTRGADKTEPPASQTPVIAHEIVPGKFNENDWNIMVDKDSGDEFAMDIVDELMEKTMATIYDKYIERQLLPFTITQARDAITEIIEWQFLARDEGELEIESNLGWSQDEEPEPAMTDCWAQGSVPCSFLPPPEVPLEEIAEETEAQVDLEMESENLETKNTKKELSEIPDTVSEVDQPETKSENTKSEKEETADSQKSDAKAKQRTKFRPYKGKLKSASVKRMTESLEETEMKMMYDEYNSMNEMCEDVPSTILNMPASCTSILKVQTGRPPGNKDVIYDDFGNVVAVMKLDPEKLPNHKVSVKYHVVDPAVEAAQARLDAMRKGKSTGSKTKKLQSKKLSTVDINSSDKKDSPKKRSNKVLKAKPRSVTKSKPLASSKTGGTSSKAKPNVPSQTMAPLPPPLKQVESIDSAATLKGAKNDEEIQMAQWIEEMEVSHGVTVKEGGRVKKGPGRYYRKLDILEESQKGMAPVALRLTNPGITVADLLDRHTPILRPLSETSPLPPIVRSTTQQPGIRTS